MADAFPPSCSVGSASLAAVVALGCASSVLWTGPRSKFGGEELKAQCRAASHGEKGLCCAGSHCTELRCLGGDKSQLQCCQGPLCAILEAWHSQRVCLWDGVCWHWDSSGNGIVSSLAGDPNCPSWGWNSVWWRHS